MSLRKTFLALIVTILAFGFCFDRRVDATEWFDSYSKIPWKDEISRLNNLSYFLRNNPDTIGCIIYQWTNKDDRKKMRARALRARRYLIHKRKVDKSRIVVIDGKERPEPQTILEPIRKGAPPPAF